MKNLDRTMCTGEREIQILLEKSSTGILQFVKKFNAISNFQVTGKNSGVERTIASRCTTVKIKVC